MARPMLSGTPVDNAANRARADELGMPETIQSMMFGLTYKDQVEVTCERCGCEMYLGPELQKARVKYAVLDPEVICHLCAAFEYAVSEMIDQPLPVVQLSNKMPGE